MNLYSDAERERLILVTEQTLVSTQSRAERLLLWQIFTGLIRHRSPGRVRAMEIQKGLSCG